MQQADGRSRRRPAGVLEQAEHGGRRPGLLAEGRHGRRRGVREDQAQRGDAGKERPVEETKAAEPGPRLDPQEHARDGREGGGGVEDAVRAEAAQQEAIELGGQEQPDRVAREIDTERLG